MSDDFRGAIAYTNYHMSELMSVRQWVAWIIITTVVPSTAVFFHGTYCGTESVVPRNTTF